MNLEDAQLAEDSRLVDGAFVYGVWLGLVDQLAETTMRVVVSFYIRGPKYFTKAQFSHVNPFRL